MFCNISYVQLCDYSLTHSLTHFIKYLLSYPNSRDAIASKNNLLLIRMAQLPLKIYERTQSVYTLRVSPGTCHVSNRQSDQVQQSCNEDLRR